MSTSVGSTVGRSIPVAGKSKNLLAPLSDSEALAVMKGGVLLYNSPQCPIKGIAEQFEQPSEVQQTYDTLKALSEAAHPNESKQDANERAEQRKVFNERMGNFIDTVLLASRKAPGLLSTFNLDGLFQDRTKQVGKTLIPHLILQVMDKELGMVRCRVRGGVKKGIEIQHAYDDPSNEANWLHLDSYVNANFSMPGLTSGRRTYMRGRYIFSKGRKSPWSEIASIMVP
jgi:hypothetical protein